MNNTYSAPGAAVLQRWLYLRLDYMIKSPFHGRLLFTITIKVLDTVAFNQGLEIRVEEFLALVRL